MNIPYLKGLTTGIVLTLLTSLPLVWYTICVQWEKRMNYLQEMCSKGTAIVEVDNKYFVCSPVRGVDDWM